MNYSFKHKSLESTLTRVLLTVAVLTLFFTLILSASIFYQSYRAAYRSELERMTVVTPIIGKSLAGEVLFGDQRAITALKSELLKSQNVTRIEIGDNSESCQFQFGLNLFRHQEICTKYRFPFSAKNQFLYVYNFISPPTPKVVIGLFGISSGLILLFGTLAGWAIRRKLKRAIINPMTSMAENPQFWAPANKDIALEVISLNDMMKNYIQERDAKHEEAEALKINAKMVHLAQQVAHDIRSPLAALNAATSLISALPENNRLLIRRAVQRIDDIANELISRSRRTPENESDNTEEACEAHLISGLIETIVSEKRLQFRTLKNVDIDFQMQTSNYGLFAQVNPIAIKRILSNLINNSMEALEFGNGRIYVKLFGQDRDLVIEVSDNGKGIPEHVLPLLMKEGASFGKKKGTGLGLYHANRTIQMWNGRIEIESQANAGAQVRIILPRSPEPEWFVQELQLPQAGTIVILDDDDSIHEIWKGRFTEVDLKGLEILHFKNPFEVIDWYATNRKNGNSIVYLFDHELIGFDLTGLAVAAQLEICHDTILVTSRFDEEPVRQACISKNVRMIPKALAGFVPIQKKADNDSMIAGADYILIDDNKITRDNWEMTAQIVGTNLVTYDHPAAFMKVIDLAAKDSKIYVDAHLSDGLRGEDVTRELHHKGFRNIYLATGSHPSEFNGLWWVKAITGKDPPFLKLAGKI